MDTKYSIIIPYQHSEERLPLLYACLKSLVKYSNNQFEVCVHEVGENKHLDLPKRYKYLFTKYSGVFHRAWVINRGVKELSTGDILVLMDGDLIVTQDWVNKVLQCNKVSIGWSRLHLLNEIGTRRYLDSEYLDSNRIEKTKSPSMGGAAGAVAVVPRKTFFDVKGIPEDFIGSWGGEDNIFWSKLVTLGYKMNILNCDIYHLHHSPSTPRIKEIQRKFFPMLYWNLVQWKEYDRVINSHWGVKNPDAWILPSLDYISSISDAKLTIAMLSWLRYDKLIATLTHHLESITIPVNLVLMVQGSEKLEEKQRENIRSLANQFSSNDVFFTKGNIGTGPARKTLLTRTLRRFKTPYINLADDDTTYSDGSVESTINFLDDNLDVGIAGIRYKPNIYKLDDTFNPLTFNIVNAENSVEYVDSTGSASAIIRSDVFDLCKIDPFYIIGEWDIDLCMQARSVGWKIVNLQFSDDMKAINNFGGCKEYREARLDRKGIKRSIKYFKKKWGLNRAL